MRLSGREEFFNCRGEKISTCGWLAGFLHNVIQTLKKAKTQSVGPYRCQRGQRWISGNVNDGRREAGSIVTQANAARTAAHRTFNDTNKTRVPRITIIITRLASIFHLRHRPLSIQTAVQSPILSPHPCGSAESWASKRIGTSRNSTLDGWTGENGKRTRHRLWG